MRCLGLPPAAPPVAVVPYRTAVATAFAPVRPTGLGDIFSALASIAGGIFGASSAADAQKAAAKEQRRAAEATATATTQQAQIAADAYKATASAQLDAAKYAADLQWRAAQAKSQADLDAVRVEYGAALDALRQQRFAAADQQAAQLVSNTAAAMFSLSNAGLVQAGTTARRYPTTATAGIVLLAAVTLFALTRAKKGEKKRSVKIGGHAYETSHAYGEAA